MKKLPTFSLKRIFASVAILSVLAGSLMSATGTFIAAQHAAAQALPPGGNQATNSTIFSWVNAGTITSNGATYFNSDITNSQDFVNTAAGDCTYQGKTVHNDTIRIGGTGLANRTVDQGTRLQVDPAKVDATNTPTCESKISVQMTGANTSKAAILFYQDGDTVYSYDGAHSYTKTKHVDTSDGGADLYIQSDEFSDPCPTVLVHGAPGIPEPHQDYGTDWFIFPMSTKDQTGSVALSEKFGRLGFPNANDNCRVDSGILKQLRYGNTTGADGGVSGDLKVYVGFTIMFGDDAYKINAGVGTKDANGPPAGSTPPGQANANNGPVAKTACDQSFGFIGFLSLKWLVCPVVDFITKTVTTLEDFLVTQLNITIDPPLASNGSYHKIWASLRTIALAIIVVVALVMVIFEAAGIEAFSAYTMRTLLTRFGVAVLMIVLSWAILREVTQVVNWITEGARQLIYAPFTDASRGGKGLETGSAYILAALSGGAIIALGPWGILSFVLTAALSIGLTLLVLVLVHSLVYILIMFSPVAIALSVLPNTRKGYEFWKNALASLYIGLIAVAFAMPAIDVIAESTYNLKDGSTATIVNQITALLLKFMRVFLVLFIFSRVGGVLSTLTGMVNDRGKGAFDRLKNFRSNTVKSRAAKAAQGELYKGRTPFGKAFNATTRGVTTFARSDNKRQLMGLASSRNRRQAWAAANEQNDTINAMRYGKTEKAQAAQHNDPLLRAQTYRTEQEARRNMANDWGMQQEDVERAITAAKVNGGFSYVRQQNATRQLARTGTGYDNLNQLHDTVNRVAGNNDEMVNSLLGGINSDTKGAGRFDLAAGHGYHVQLNAARRNLNRNDPASVANYNRMVERGYVEAVKGNAAHDMMRSKPRAMDNTMPAFSSAIAESQRVMNSSTATAQERQQAAEDFGRMTQVMESYKQAGVYAAPENVRRFEEHGYSATEQERAKAAQISSQVSPNAQVFNPVTMQMETVYETDAAGNVQLDRNGRPIPLANPEFNPGTARGRQEQSMPRPYDPNDPRNP